MSHRVKEPVRQVKIMFIVNDLGFGGLERRVLELIKGLLREGGFEIILVLMEKRVEFDYVYSLPIELVMMEKKAGFDFSEVRELSAIVRSKKPDLIHLWSSKAVITLIPVLLSKKYPTISNLIADAPASIQVFNKEYLKTRIAYFFSDIVLSNSKAGLKAYHAPRRKSFCIYNGLDLKRFEDLDDPQTIRRDLFGTDNKDLFVAGMVANFEERKDYQTVVEAAIELCRRRGNIRFLLIGTGTLLESIRARVPAELLDRKILFLGKRADVESLLQVVDLGLLLTNSRLHGEGISNSIIEYMASGKPVIASRGGGTDEVVMDAVNGFRIDSFSRVQLVEKITYMMDHPDQCKKMGAEARKFVQAHFNLDNMTEQFMQQYKKLLT
jgi:glycosyltransferase involved in cell wall biosynthesis